MAQRYQILGKMARGGIGAIYRARDTIMGREVAIKRLLPLEQTHLNEAADDSLRREAAALARFQHPNVVSIYAFEEDDEGDYVVMELVNGENLKETIERGALPLEDFEELTLQVLDPLIAARDLNLLHRDIKPSNIMLTWLATGKFHLKLLDFGLAKFSQQPSLQTLDQTGSFLGSIDYLAPEQLELKPLDQRTDLYSLGCVLYYCLTQSPPFEGENAAKTMANHMKHRVTPIHEIRPDIPRPLADWVMRMISRYTNQRPADAREALKEFEAARKGLSPIGSRNGDVPFAQIAASPASSPPVNPPPGAPPERASDPVNPSVPPRKATKIHTRPQLTARSQVPGKRPIASPSRHQTGSSRIPAAESPRPARDSRTTKPLAALALTAMALVAVLAVLRGKSVKEALPPPSPAVASAASLSLGVEPNKAAPPAGPAFPQFRNAEDPLRKTPVPAVTDGLIAHYSAADQVIGPDLTKPVQSGQRATVWGNLAPGAAPNHFLTIPSQGNSNGLWLETAFPKQHPELKNPIPALKFGPETLMVSRGDQVKSLFGSAGLTQIAVMRIVSGNGRFLEYRLPDNRFALDFSAVAGGYASSMHRGSIRQSTETKLGAHRPEWVVFSMTWDPKQEKQRHFFGLGNGHRIPGPPGDAPFLPMTAVGYRIGATPGNPGTETPRPVGHLAELLIYDRLLTDEERKQVEDQLFDRYFDPRFDRKLNIAIPREDGTVPTARNPKNYNPKTPPPPVADGLVGHYHAGELTFGYDLETPTEDGGNVLAWGNIAKGAAEDHLMEFQSGQAAATPILQATGPKEDPSLNGTHPALFFTPRSTLRAIGQAEKDALSKGGLTGFLVFKADGKSNNIFRMEMGESRRLLTISRNENLFKSTMQIAPNQWNPVTRSIPPNRFTVLSFVWDHENGRQTLFARQGDGQTMASESDAGPVGAREIDRYWLGLFQPPGKNDTPTFSGKVAELILYARPLTLEERQSVEDHLQRRYFGK